MTNCIFLKSQFSPGCYTIIVVFQKKSLMLAFHVTCNHYTIYNPNSLDIICVFPFYIYINCYHIIQLSRYFSIFFIIIRTTNKLVCALWSWMSRPQKGIKVLFCLGLQSLAHCFILEQMLESTSIDKKLLTCLNFHYLAQLNFPV